MATTDDIKAAHDTFVAEDAKFVAGNKSAGARARKALQNLTKLAKVRRVEIQAAKNEAKGK